MVLWYKKNIFSRFQRGVQYFPGSGSNIFQETQLRIPIETYRTCNFPLDSRKQLLCDHCKLLFVSNINDDKSSPISGRMISNRFYM